MEQPTAPIQSETETESHSNFARFVEALPWCGLTMWKFIDDLIRIILYRRDPILRMMRRLLLR